MKTLFQKLKFLTRPTFVIPTLFYSFIGIQVYKFIIFPYTSTYSSFIKQLQQSHNFQFEQAFWKQTQLNNQRLSLIKLLSSKQQLQKISQNKKQKIEKIVEWLSFAQPNNYKYKMLLALLVGSLVGSFIMPKLSVVTLSAILWMKFGRLWKDLEVIRRDDNNISNEKYSQKQVNKQKSIISLIHIPQNDQLLNYQLYLLGGFIFCGLSSVVIKSLDAKMSMKMLKNWKEQNRKFR